MGGVNNICVDKTGTLTENTLTIEKIWNTSYVFYTHQNTLNSL